MQSDHLPRQFVRFLVAGGVNTLFGYSAYAVFVLAGLTPAIALLAATVLGVLFNFVTFGGFVFHGLNRAAIPRFVVAYGVVYTLNLALLEALREFGGLRPLVAQLVCLPVVIPATFILLRESVFAKRRTG